MFLFLIILLVGPGYAEQCPDRCKAEILGNPWDDIGFRKCAEKLPGSEKDNDSEDCDCKMVVMEGILELVDSGTDFRYREVGCGASLDERCDKMEEKLWEFFEGDDYYASDIFVYFDRDKCYFGEISDNTWLN